MTEPVLEIPAPPTRDRMDDDTLVTLFQSGDTQAFRILVERHKERVRNLVYSILNTPGIVDDLAQEVFIKVYDALPNFRFDSSFYTWVYRITVNRCRDEIRKRKVRKLLPLHLLMENHDSELLARTIVHPKDGETAALIEKSLQTLPEKFRLPVILKDIDGLAYEEIAEVLQCELGTVKSRLSRGRAMMRKVLAPLIDGDVNT